MKILTVRTRPASCWALWPVWRPGEGAWPGPAVRRTATWTGPWPLWCQWMTRRGEGRRPRSAAGHPVTWTAVAAAAVDRPCCPRLGDATPASWWSPTTSVRRRRLSRRRRLRRTTAVATLASPCWKQRQQRQQWQQWQQWYYGSDSPTGVPARGSCESVGRRGRRRVGHEFPAIFDFRYIWNEHSDTL